MNLADLLDTQSEPGYLQCSAKGCKNNAKYEILWNNPKIHIQERRKIWLCCEDHLDYLENFLKKRTFWKETKILFKNN